MEAKHLYISMGKFVGSEAQKDLEIAFLHS